MKFNSCFNKNEVLLEIIIKQYLILFINFKNKLSNLMKK